ncbi:MAG: hypothetical protein KDD38_11145 [Bdellovibrionales bacterium]|nr:hypothetical protein [Bdellovibrionales bacterium]
MKKLLTTTAVLCLGATVAFAAPKVEVKVKPETRVKTSGSKLGNEKLGAEVTARPNVGAKTATAAGAATSGNILTQAAKASVADKLGSSCTISGMSSAQLGVIAEAKARGLSSTSCLDKFKDDASVQLRAQKIIAAQNQAFTNLGANDVTGDGKVDVKDLATDSQRAIILKAGAEVLARDLGLDTKSALDRLEGTVSEGCDMISGNLGTASAFNAARAL